MEKFSTKDLEIVRRYLYGRAGESSVPDLLSSDRIRAPQAGQANRVGISLSSYMDPTSGAGRFATGAMFELVNIFFLQLSGLTNWPSGAPETYKGYDTASYLSANLAPGRYTKQQLAEIFSLDSYGFVMQQHGFSDARDDRAARTFIYGSSQYALGDVTFVVEANGNRYVEDFSVAPRYLSANRPEADNYDYDGGFIADLAGPYLQGQTDPSEIGQTVYFNYVEDRPSGDRYDLTDYLADVQKSSTWALHSLPSLSEINLLLDQLWEDGITYFVDGQNRPIIYGKHGDSEVDPLGIINQFGSRLKLSNGNGVVVVEDDGNDKLYGTIYNDRLIGNGGNDTLNGLLGADDIDGGSGNDTLLAGGGSNSLTVGGLGRDWIYNKATDGIIWGDLVNSIERADGSRIAIVGGQQVVIADDKSNADTFWFARDVTIMDAQRSDRLKFYGMTLTGGDTTMTTAALAVSTLVSPLFGAGLAGAAAAVNLGRMAADLPLIYFDRFVPWINYKLVDGEAEGTKDLLVGYVLDDLLNLFGLLDGGAAPAPKGVMRVVDFDRGAGRIFSQSGDLGISLDDFNPLAILSLLSPRVAGVPIAQSLMAAMLASAMAASVDYMARRYTGFAKDNGWLAEGDPLVIDLDGDGIETISLRDSRAYFDVDGDLFREKTGWLKGDDGFLVLDANANGRIDDISEMFGNRFQGGYAELAAYDTNALGGNGDGKISVADLIWSELKVWQDRDRDGETDAGELKSLSALGIREISLTSTALERRTENVNRGIPFCADL
jgi:RTX calcium-binding nonapeptide repeat (4 copies)